MGVLNNPVLILNSSWIPIRVKDVRKAIILTSRERGYIIDAIDYKIYSWEQWIRIKVKEGENFIQAVRFKVKLPEVILLSRYGKIPNFGVKLTKRNIFIRDKYICQYTGRKLKSQEADIDHVVPKSKGGRTTWDNLVVTSKKINREKGDKTLIKADLRLIKNPFKPSSRNILFDPRKKIPDSWKKFI